LGELKHGVYDDCEGLSEEEIYAFYDFEDDDGIQDDSPDSSYDEWDSRVDADELGAEDAVINHCFNFT
jgi:hypothetical protein